VPPIELRALPSGAVGELLTLQRAAYVTEAQLYDDVRLPALVQTPDELADELARSSCLAALAGSRLVVAPDLQGRGIGTRLLLAAERSTTLPRAALFTGARSTANLRLYRRHGYVETAREPVRPGLELVHLVKELR
jgi:GNAT superfamily N-acetyltransferase